MQVTNWPIENVKPFHNNSRIHDEKSINAITASVDRFSWLQPIVVSSDGVVIMGHGRLAAAKELGMTEVPVLVADWLTDNEVAAAREADNMTQDLSYFDMELLNMNLGEIDWLDIDMSEFGFKLDDELFGEAEEDDYTEDDASDAPSRAQRGDIWQLGEHRLMCGDSTSETDVDALLQGGNANLLLTDPPYGVDIVKNVTERDGKLYGTTRSQGAKKAMLPSTEYSPIIGDNTTETARNSYEIARTRTETQILFGGNYFTDFLDPSRCWIVWDKGKPDGVFYAPVELAWVSKDGNAKLYKRIWHGMYREGSREVEGVNRMHSTQKPVSLMGDILNDFTKDGDTVLDLFGGSGSTLISCEQLGRKCYMMELDPHYCDVIIDRWEKLTGKEAVRL